MAEASDRPVNAADAEMSLGGYLVSFRLRKACLMPGIIRQYNVGVSGTMWFALIDPAWRPSTPEDTPPSSQMVGGWRLDTEGRPGPFEPNPHYLPADGGGPTDPIDYGLRAAARGEPVGDQLIAMVRDSVVEIVCDEQGRPQVGPAPDEAPCVLVATSPRQRDQSPLDFHWVPVVGSKLPDIVPSGVDILLNLGGPAPLRLFTDALRAGEQGRIQEP